MTTPSHYTGDLEKKFNYHWDAGRAHPDAWAFFIELTDQVAAGKLKVGYVREQFYANNTPTVTMMSRHAYYRWARSLDHWRAGKVAQEP